MALKADMGWSMEQLTGGAGGQGVQESAATSSKKGKKDKKGAATDPMLWGIPGHLTAEEAEVYVKFQAEVEKRGGEFKKTVYSFGEEEGEVWALCRWLRARKFVFDDVIKMIEEATQVRKDALAHDFYPNPVDALGVDSSIFFSQYPQLYSGVAKNGAPLFISKPGILNVDGMECITTLDGIIKFHWNVMMHDFANRLQKQKADNPDTFKRFECVSVLDLEGLSPSQLSRRALAIVKEQSAIDSICFPETMSKMFIVNSPTFFSATWRIIKGWLDPRTVGKIEVISSRSAGEKKLLEFVDADQLPSDYGGKGPDTRDTLAKGFEGETSRLVTRVLYLRGHGSESIEVKDGETLEIVVFTRSTSGAKFTMVDGNSKDQISDAVEVKHTGTDDPSEMPTRKVLNGGKELVGPMVVKVKADSNASRFSTHNYLLVCSFSKTISKTK